MSGRYSPPSPRQIPQQAAYRDQQLAPLEPEETSHGIIQRGGVVGWWLNLTAPRWPARSLPIAERERLRKAELTSVSFLALFAFLLALVSNSLADPGTAQAVVVMAIILVIAALFNRTGRTRVAAYLTPSALMLLTAAAVLQAPGGLRLVAFPAYDLFAVPIFLVSLTGSARAPWVFALAAIGFVVGDFLLQPHATIQVNGLPFDGLDYEAKIFTAWGLINRHIALLFFAAFFSWLGARSVDNAIARADQAEAIAQLEHAFAEQTRQLEYGIEAIRQTHARIANGDFSARAPLAQEHILWQIAYSLNNLIQRLQRSQEAEDMLRRTQAEITRLVQEIQRAKSGLQPLWPPPSGTLLDPLVKEFADAGSGRRY